MLVTDQPVESPHGTMEQEWLTQMRKRSLAFSEREVRVVEADPIYPIKTRPYPWEESARSVRVGKARQALRRCGHDTGPVDYRYGPRTREALHRFQKAHDLPPTRLPDDTTLGALERECLLGEDER